MKHEKNGASLPSGVIESDLRFPKWKEKNGKLAFDAGDNGSLLLYEVAGLGWVITTLRIGSGRRFNAADRYYGIRVSDGAGVRVGKGPHVVREIRIYIRESRRKALARLIELYNSGLTQAHTTRDRISSRRFQGQIERAEGRQSWLWKV